MPSLIGPPSGCRFRIRCRYATDLCAEVDPPLAQVAPGRLVACHFPRAMDLPIPSYDSADGQQGVEL